MKNGLQMISICAVHNIYTFFFKLYTVGYKQKNAVGRGRKICLIKLANNDKKKIRGLIFLTNVL